MGMLRTLFAIAVVFAHTYGFVLVGGTHAVRLFYMISGFLISYVLVEKKAYPTIGNFYRNRYLRLYPVYFVVAMLTFLLFSLATFCMGKHMEFFGVYGSAPWAAKALLLFSNLTLFLQDWVMFAGVEGNQLAFTTDFTKGEVVLYKGLLVPQAWTLGVELSFYLIAPFILPRRKVLISLFITSILLRFYLISIGIGMSDPWTYRFFPTELALFLSGALSHQILLPYYRRVLVGKTIDTYANLATVFLVLLTITYWQLPLSDIMKTILLFSSFLFLMPLAFLFQAKKRWDKWIGNLSYPIYICHMLVIYVVGFVSTKLGIGDVVVTSIVVITLSILFSIILNRYVAEPMESLRSGYRAG